MQLDQIVTKEKYHLFHRLHKNKNSQLILIKRSLPRQQLRQENKLAQTHK